MTWLGRRWAGARAGWPAWARRLTSRWVLGPLGAVALLLIAFVVYGAITRIGPTGFSKGGPFGPQPAPSPTPSRAAPTASPAATPRPVAPTPSPSAAGTPSPGAPSPSAAPAPAGVAVPATGAYRVAIDGSEQVRFGPFSFCERDFPKDSTLAVKKGDTQGSFVFDHEFSSLHKERHIYRYTRGGVFLDFEGAEVSCGGVEMPSETEFEPPELKVKLPLAVGASWRGRGGDADRTEDYSAKVLRTERVTVEGRAVQTYVVETTITLTGSENGRRLQRWWYAPRLAIPVRWYEEIEASRMGATFSEAATFTVTDLP